MHSFFYLVVEEDIILKKKSVNEWLKARIKEKKIICPDEPQGVNKDRITAVLNKLDRFSEDRRDAIYALLDNLSPNWYSTAPPASTFCDGASTAHIGAHVAILQRGYDAKLDREGRDKWLKPLSDIGAIEPCYLPSKDDTGLENQFYIGHLKAKSPNNCYRLIPSFVKILTAPEKQWESLLGEWSSEDKIRQRLKEQAELTDQLKRLADNSHSALIQTCRNFYVTKFLPEFQVVYIDDGDGDRVTEEQKLKLQKAGLSLTLHDAMPDILLWNPIEDSLWVIEAVTSDGEVDNHKVNKMKEFTVRNGKKQIGFTTAYLTWKKAAERQKSTRGNLAIGSYLWIMEDSAKNFQINGSLT